MKSLYYIFIVLISFSCKVDKNISDFEVENFRLSIDTSIKDNKPYFLDNIISYSIIEKEAKQQNILSGRIGVVLKLGSMITSEVFTEGEFMLTKQHRVTNDKVVLTYRLLSENAFTYYDFEVQKINGFLKIVDIYFYHLGTSLKNHVMNHLRGFGDDYSINYVVKEWVSEINLKLNAENYKEAKELYKQLLKQYDTNEFSFLNFKRNFGYSILDTVLIEKMTLKMNELKPDQIRYVLRNEVAYHNYINNEQTKRRETIDSFKKYVGEDYLLNYYIGESYMIENNFNKADSIFESIKKEHPQSPFSYESQIRMNVFNEKYKNAIKLFKEFNDNFIVDVTPQVFFKNNVDFLNSTEFRKEFDKN